MQEQKTNEQNERVFSHLNNNRVYLDIFFLSYSISDGSMFRKTMPYRYLQIIQDKKKHHAAKVTVQGRYQIPVI